MRMRNAWLLAALLPIMAGCTARSGLTVATHQAQGNGRIALDPTNPRRLTMTLLNLRDVGYDFDNATDRASFVEAMLTLQCGKPSIAETRETVTGDSGVRIFKLYFLTIDCPNGASRLVAR